MFRLNHLTSNMSRLRKYLYNSMRNHLINPKGIELEEEQKQEYMRGIGPDLMEKYIGLMHDAFRLLRYYESIVFWTEHGIGPLTRSEQVRVFMCDYFETIRGIIKYLDIMYESFNAMYESIRSDERDEIQRKYYSKRMYAISCIKDDIFKDIREKIIRVNTSVDECDYRRYVVKLNNREIFIEPKRSLITSKFIDGSYPYGCIIVYDREYDVVYELGRITREYHYKNMLSPVQLCTLLALEKAILERSCIYSDEVDECTCIDDNADEVMYSADASNCVCENDFMMNRVGFNNYVESALYPNILRSRRQIYDKCESIVRFISVLVRYSAPYVVFKVMGNIERSHQSIHTSRYIDSSHVHSQIPSGCLR